MASLAIPSFIASAASTLSLQVDLLSDCGKSNFSRPIYLSALSAKFGEVTETLPTKQPGTGLMFLMIRHWLKPLSVRHTIWLPF